MACVSSPNEPSQHSRADSKACGSASINERELCTTLASSAESYSRQMANNNFFDHKDREGRTPGDRAELAGYSARLIGENIAAGHDSVSKVVNGWLASPGHCANLMNPQFQELGAAYAVDPKSDAGIYWTAMFGTP